MAIKISNPVPWYAIIERKRRAADRAEERARQLRAEADELEVQAVYSQGKTAGRSKNE